MIMGDDYEDYDFFIWKYHDGFLKIAFIVHHETIKKLNFDYRG